MTFIPTAGAQPFVGSDATTTALPSAFDSAAKAAETSSEETTAEWVDRNAVGTSTKGDGGVMQDYSSEIQCQRERMWWHGKASCERTHICLYMQAGAMHTSRSAAGPTLAIDSAVVLSGDSESELEGERLFPEPPQPGQSGRPADDAFQEGSALADLNHRPSTPRQSPR